MRIDPTQRYSHNKWIKNSIIAFCIDRLKICYNVQFARILQIFASPNIVTIRHLNNADMPYIRQCETTAGMTGWHDIHAMY